MEFAPILSSAAISSFRRSHACRLLRSRLSPTRTKIYFAVQNC